MTTDHPNIADFDPDHLNQIAGLLQNIYGFLPLNVRYQAAAYALNHVREWQQAGPDWVEDTS